MAAVLGAFFSVCAAGLQSTAVVAAGEPAPPVPATAERRAPAVAGEIIVRYESRAWSRSLRRSVGARLLRRLPLARTEVVKVAPGTTRQAIARLEASPGVVFAEPNYIVRASAVPNDPLFPQQWALDNTGQTGGTPGADVSALQAWDTTTGSAEPVVAIVDSGVDWRHPDLAGNIWANPRESEDGIDNDGNGLIDDVRGYDWVDDDVDPTDLNGHGTHVAGIVGAQGNDASGPVGIAWDVSLMPLRILDEQGFGTSADLTSAFTYAGAAGAEVVNASLGGPRIAQAVVDAIAAAPETLFVFASGNAGRNNDVAPEYPCALPAANVLCVTATDSSDNLAGFANTGATTVDLAAPGVGILSTLPDLGHPFEDDFESELSLKWITGGNVTWGRTNDGAGNYLSDSPVGPYADDMDAWVEVRNPIDLKDRSACRLVYSLRIDMEEGVDGLLVEGSSDGVTWTRIAGWTGSSSGQWLLMSDDLTAWSGTATFFIRYRALSNESVTGDGISIDDVALRCWGNNTFTSPYGSFSGTSMAAPHVAGAAALLESAVPSASVAAIRQALLDGADRLPALADKTVTGGRLNVAASLTSLLASQAAPDPTPVPPSPDPTPSESPTPDPSPTPTPESIPTPEVTPSPEPSPSVLPVTIHARSVTLNVAPNLAARGRVRVPDGFTSCRSRIPIVIKRNGKTIERLVTGSEGRFRTALPQGTGAYVARAPALELDDHVCSFARSDIVRPTRAALPGYASSVIAF